jgi:hypothetical protein
MSSSIEKKSNENSYFDADRHLKQSLKDVKQTLDSQKSNILKKIEHSINTKIEGLVRQVYNTQRKSPVLKLENSKYDFKTVDDTGTGTAYSNLILFDLAILELTNLPLVIHDSILFKHIEDKAFAGLVKIYASHAKQTFISIDGINKYDKETQATLTDNAAIQLTNEKLLYDKDWRK